MAVHSIAMRHWQQVGAQWISQGSKPGFKSWVRAYYGVVYFQRDWDQDSGPCMNVVFDSEDDALMFRLKY
jgi:hypothetical protein